MTTVMMFNLYGSTRDYWLFDEEDERTRRRML